MKIQRRLVLAAIACAASFGAAAQANFPDHPITFVVPFAAGSATDQLARALGQAITADTKQAVIVDNKPGANSAHRRPRRDRKTATRCSSPRIPRRPRTSTCSRSCPTTP